MVWGPSSQWERLINWVCAILCKLLESKGQATPAQLVERLIRNFRLWLYATHSRVGHEVVLWAYWALIESDFESNSPVRRRRGAYRLIPLASPFTPPQRFC